MAEVTLFPKASTSTGAAYSDHETIVDHIRTGRWRNLVEQLNAMEYGSEQQKQFKQNSLPGIVWQGRFTQRNSDNIVRHSGLVCLDFDKMPPEDLQHYRDILVGDPHTHILFKSPRLNGLKVIVRIPPDIDAHREYMAGLRARYASKYYDHFDDICRLCFVSYDPDIYYNPNSEVWTTKGSLSKRKSKTQSTVHIPKDIRGMFNRLAAWADGREGYTDGNKHRHLISLLGALNRFGVPQDDAADLCYERYGTMAGVEPVPLSDYQRRAQSVYTLYGSAHGVESFQDDTPPAIDISTPGAPTDTPGGVVQAVTAPHSFHNTDPVSWYNYNQAEHAMSLLREATQWERDEDGQWIIAQRDLAATWLVDNLIIETETFRPLQRGCKYTPFQLLVILKFKGIYRHAFEWVISNFFHEDIPYLRIGVDYFKQIAKTDRFNIPRTEIKRWSKDEIKEDLGKPYLSKIPRYDDFTILPDNFNYQPIVNNCYNLYRPFPHKPVEGDFKWSEILMRHIFGDQYQIGLRYMQILYLHPDRLMPILVLVSRERQTGKTTFLNWINMIFGDNVANISPEDLTNGFNYAYAGSNIVTVEETLIEKSVTVEKLKALATQKFITVNQKFVSQYRMPFFGKIIMASNNEDKFARIDQEEIRFFVRKVPIPTLYNHDIESSLVSEIPAFLHYLTKLPAVDFSVDRTGFLPSELDNNSLATVKRESQSELCRELQSRFEDLFFNELSADTEFDVDARSVKEKWYVTQHSISATYIRRVMIKELKIKFDAKIKRFRPFVTGESRIGRNVFTVYREDITDIPPDKTKEIPF